MKTPSMKMPLYLSLHTVAAVTNTSFKKMKTPFKAMRYHSLIVKKETLPPELEITAETDDGVIMGLRHKKFLIEREMKLSANR